MLRISTQGDDLCIRFKLEGKLVGPWVDELRQCWRSVPNQSGRRVEIDLAEVTFIDASGKQLLAEMREIEIVLLPGPGPLIRQIVQDIERRQKSQITRAAHVAILLFLIFFVPSRGASQQAPLRINLNDAIHLAMKQNPQVQIAALNVATSQQEKLIARSALLPQAGTEISERAEKYSVEAFIGQPIPGFPRAAGPFQVFQAGAGFSAPVFDLTLWRRWQAAGESVNGASAVATSVREQISLLVVSQYLGCLRASEEVHASESRVELAQALYELANHMQESGVGTGIDALRANVQLQNEKQKLIMARVQYDTARYGLARLLNLPSNQEIELSDQLSFATVREESSERALQDALISRPEMKALNARALAVERTSQAASASRLPRFTFGGNWGYQGLSATNSIPAYQYQITARFPLFTGGRIKAERAKANIELEKISHERDELKQKITLEVKTANAMLTAAHNEVAVANLAVQLADDEVIEARHRFEAGVSNNIELITAQDELARASDNQIGALYRYNQARADLAHATGRMESLYGR